jgi:hypothetical protein
MTIVNLFTSILIFTFMGLSAAALYINSRQWKVRLSVIMWLICMALILALIFY